jgi:modified peptide precursor CbpA
MTAAATFFMKLSHGWIIHPIYKGMGKAVSNGHINKKARGVRMKKSVKRPIKDVIAYCKKCKANGTGLSHYILMDKKAK